MIGRPLTAALAAALAAALGGTLSGCVAAVIPLAAAGTIGKRKLDGPAAKPTPVAVAAAPARARLTMLPAGTRLPPPGGTLFVTTTTPEPEAGWRALVRHVARAMSTGASCSDATTAVLIAADVAAARSAERDAAVASLNALRTMGASVTFVANDLAAARAALVAAGMASADIHVATLADVLAIARTGCVVASGGGTRADFTGLAWFALPPLPNTIVAAATP